MKSATCKLSEVMYLPWAGIFEKEKAMMLSWTEDQIVEILKSPDKQTENVEHRYLIYKMLQSLYQKQTSQEQSMHATANVNNIGFNKYDAEFLTDVAEKSQKYKNLTPNQAAAVGKALVKYRKQLRQIALEHLTSQERLMKG